MAISYRLFYWLHIIKTGRQLPQTPCRRSTLGIMHINPSATYCCLIINLSFSSLSMEDPAQSKTRRLSVDPADPGWAQIFLMMRPSQSYRKMEGRVYRKMV